jgi:hypothetical protein
MGRNDTQNNTKKQKTQNKKNRTNKENTYIKRVIKKT